MSQLSESPKASPVSATNFDLPSLHILQNEIDAALKNAESHLSDFNDDEEQAPLLLDSVDVMQQLAQILELLSLDGGSDLTRDIADSLQLLYNRGDNNDEGIILDISEAIITLDRYVEFVLLKETLEPTLLIPIINKLHAHLDKPMLNENSFAERGTSSISISNPEKNFVSPSQLNLDTQLLCSAYRSGLSVVLSAKNKNLTDSDTKKLIAMQSACAVVSEKSESLFWQAATAVITDIDKILPLKTPQKRTLVFLEQQFNSYISINDKRFADLVSFACQRDNKLAASVKQEYAKNRLDASEYKLMSQFLFGPNRDVTDTLNNIIQEQVNKIKDSVDILVRGEDTVNTTSTEQISVDLHGLGTGMRLLNLHDAAKALITESQEVLKWQSPPTPENFDQLLSALIVAENASIHMAKRHTPGAVNLPIHNNNISLHQLDTSYETIVVESRSNIAKIEQFITDFIQDDSHSKEHLTDIPVLLRQVSGSMNFLHLQDAAQMVIRLAAYIENEMINNVTSYNEKELNHVADIIIAVDYHLEGFENNHPVGKQAMNIGHHSLRELLAA